LDARADFKHRINNIAAYHRHAFGMVNMNAVRDWLTVIARNFVLTNTQRRSMLFCTNKC